MVGERVGLRERVWDVRMDGLYMLHKVFNDAENTEILASAE